MEEMAATVYTGDGALAVQRLPVPVPAAGEALVAVSHCGICGTDLHLVLERYARPGSVLGHEWSGTVAEVGDGVDVALVGTRVVANPTPGCGECRACRRGRPSVCLRRATPDLLGFRGAFCEYVVVDAARLLRVPESLPLRAAALTEPTAIALHTCILSGVTPDDRVLITGGGPVGLLMLAVMRARGVGDITVSEPAQPRRDQARALGAARVLHPDDLPRAPMGRPVDDPYTIAFECSGRASAAEAALDQLDYAGTLVFVGTGHELPRVNHNRVIVLELSIIGAYNYDFDGFAGAVALLDSGQLPLDLLIEPADIGLDDVLATMERLARGELPGKVMVAP
jgi:2-desacetyl-2-hydroxyethyl bacteriochlorophyllide A dehydrogenase